MTRWYLELNTHKRLQGLWLALAARDALNRRDPTHPDFEG